MFENVLGVEGVIADLSRDIQRNTLPPALLLAGPRYNAKSTIALEIARVLTCRQGGAWGCTCRSCLQHRGLHHHDLLIAGDRYFDAEIRAAGHAFLASPRVGTAFLFVRAVRKLTRRFDAVLWPDARVKKFERLVTEVEELLEEVEPRENLSLPWEGGTEEKRSKLIERITVASGKLQGALPHDPVPVDVVRAIGAWSQLSSAGGTKVALIEEAHLMQEAARNAMLKLLEEPPQNVYLILSSSRRSALIPTVLSRLRVYPVPSRSPRIEAEVQQRIFHESTPPADHLRDYFRRTDSQLSTWRELASRVWETRGDRTAWSEVDRAVHAALNDGYPRKSVEYFLDALLDHLRRLMPEAEGVRMERISRLGRTIALHWERTHTRNMSPLGVVDGVLIAVRTGAGGRA